MLVTTPVALCSLNFHLAVPLIFMLTRMGSHSPLPVIMLHCVWCLIKPLNLTNEWDSTVIDLYSVSVAYVILPDERYQCITFSPFLISHYYGGFTNHMMTVL